MRYAILADVHANLAALRAVLADAGERGIDGVWLLGDFVGYGPDPEAVITLLRNYAPLAVSGNHDLGAIGAISLDDFNPEAAAACRWTGDALGSAARAYLEGLPASAQVGEFTLVHGSPRAPAWEYVLSVGQARANFPLFAGRVCLIGHSHVPLAFEQLTASGECRVGSFFEDEPLRLDGASDSRLIVNPGSVGQPRDGDPRAAYAIYDDAQATITLRRVAYEIAETQRRMQAAGLPLSLATRLSYGL